MAALLEREVQEKDAGKKVDNALRCRLFNCDLQFRTMAAYEEHYDLYVLYEWPFKQSAHHGHYGFVLLACIATCVWSAIAPS